MMAARAAWSLASAVLPAGMPFIFSKYARMLACSCRVTTPAFPGGIVFRMRSKRSEIGTPSQVAPNETPRKAGTCSPPPSDSPWQETQCVLKSTAP